MFAHRTDFVRLQRRYRIRSDLSDYRPSSRGSDHKGAKATRFAAPAAAAAAAAAGDINDNDVWKRNPKGSEKSHLTWVRFHSILWLTCYIVL